MGDRHPQSAAQLPQYTGLQLNVATNALPVPLLYGLVKTSVNIVHYSDFYAVPLLSAEQRAGKGGATPGLQVVGWFYLAKLVLAIGEGPITKINQAWQGQKTFLFAADSPNPMGWTLPISNFNCDFYQGAPGQGVWPGLVGTPYALEYANTAFLASPQFYLGESASIGTFNIEPCGLFYGTGANGIDADPASIIDDFLNNPKHGVGYPGAIDMASLFGGDNTSSVQAYCKALGLCLSAALNQFEPAASILDRWKRAINCEFVRSGGVLRVIPYGDMDISGNGITWRANVAPVYDLTEDDLHFDEGEDPVKVDRIDPSSLPTVQRVEVLNRAGINMGAALVTQQVNEALAAMSSASSAGRGSSGYTLPAPQGQPQYQPTPVEARDMAAISTFGQRVGQTVTMHEICDLNVGATLAQILLQRQLYIRSTFKFRLNWRFCLLDPMDVVSIPLGGARKLVRITEIEEDDEGRLSITAEDFTVGVSTPGPNLTMGAMAGNNAAIPVAPVDSILIFEPPLVLTNGVAQLWLGASGGAAGVYDPNWGGAIVHASIDGGVTYVEIGRIVAPLAQGVLTANLADAVGFDTANTLSVDLAESGQTLVSTTDANAQAGVGNLSLIGGELLAFATATLSGAHTYNLTRLQRGAYGTTHAAHLSGDAFAALDNVLKVALSPQFIGVGVKFKFQSFNMYGAGLQDIATCDVFDYTPTGAGLANSTRLSTVAETLPASGAAVVSSIKVPGSDWLLRVVVTVVSALTGASSFNIDPVVKADGSAGGVGGQFGSCGGYLGATHTFTTPATLWSTDSALRLTMVGGAATAGAIAVSIQYVAAS